jgi:hypothetical protein
LKSSSRTRSAERPCSRGAASHAAAQVSASIASPKRPAKRRARSTRSQSSAKRSARRADRAQHATLQVGRAAVRVAQLVADGVPGDRVDREVAPLQVLRQRVGEPHAGAAAEGLHIATEGRDLVHPAAPRQHSDSAVLDADRHGAAEDRRTSAGLAAVARSQSSGCSPASASRTAPPTAHVSKPASSSRRAIQTTSAGAGSGCASAITPSRDRGFRVPRDVIHSPKHLAPARIGVTFIVHSNPLRA